AVEQRGGMLRARGEELLASRAGVHWRDLEEEVEGAIDRGERAVHFDDVLVERARTERHEARDRAARVRAHEFREPAPECVADGLALLARERGDRRVFGDDRGQLEADERAAL